MCCIPTPKFRVIHRSLGFEAIENPGLLEEILQALEATRPSALGMSDPIVEPLEIMGTQESSKVLEGP